MTEYLASITALKSMLTDGRNLSECLAGAPPIAKQVSYGVTRNYFSLSKTLDELLDKPIAKKNDDLKLLLLCGIYSIEHLNRPAYASVNLAVETANGLKKAWAKGLINGVLRSYLRNQNEIRAGISDLGQEAELNHPQWLIELISKAWDKKDIFEANHSRPPMTLRLNSRKTNREKYQQLLKEAGITSRTGSLTQTSIIVDEPMSVTEIPGFKKGFVSVQDEGAQIAVPLLDTKPQDRVLDACAAPGGKTGHLLEQTDIKVTAIDWNEKRVNKIADNLQRLNLDATILCQDLEKWQTTSKFNCILLDVPCSATGIIRRHPEIKLLRTKSDIDILAHKQGLLLSKAFSLLENGGELLYSTCSILPSENDEVIAKFLSSQSGVRQLEINLGQQGESIIPTQYGLQLLPTISNHDGFYYAKLRKVR